MIGVVDTSALIRLFVPDGPLPDGFEDFLRGVERRRSWRYHFFRRPKTAENRCTFTVTVAP